MTEESGVLLLELPEPFYEYTYLCKTGPFMPLYWVEYSDFKGSVLEEAYHCTRKEAEQFPQFKFVPLSEL
ncbi:hypothetical protein BKX95_08410 [Streptococcus iniae]|nr:hypothetical protein BKX95_08410 [Streptococcus iniae]